MSSSCQALRDSLKDCLLRSECVLTHGHLPSECLKEHFNELPSECQSLRKAVFECKRGMLDMRKRIRGNYPGGLSSNVGYDTTAPPDDAAA